MTWALFRGLTCGIYLYVIVSLYSERPDVVSNYTAVCNLMRPCMLIYIITSTLREAAQLPLLAWRRPKATSSQGNTLRLHHELYDAHCIIRRSTNTKCTSTACHRAGLFPIWKRHNDKVINNTKALCVGKQSYTSVRETRKRQEGKGTCYRASTFRRRVFAVNQTCQLCRRRYEQLEGERWTRGRNSQRCCNGSRYEYFDRQSDAPSNGGSCSTVQEAKKAESCA